jgi:hypothetical protein
MTSKEEAQKLVNKFNYDNKHYLMPDAKQCALIALNHLIEILELTYTPTIVIFYYKEIKQEIEQEVKQEIENFKQPNNKQ